MAYQREIDKHDILVLMEDGCTEAEAIRHLKNGSIVYDITKEPWDECYAEDVGVTLDEIKTRGHQIDYGYVTIDDVEYVIEYAL